MTISILRRCCLASLPLIVLLLSACASQPPFSGEAGDFRFYISQAQKSSKLSDQGKDLTPQPGFDFLIVDLIGENKSFQLSNSSIARATMKGRTISGDYEYQEYYPYSSQRQTDAWMPPGLRFRKTLVFEVAVTTSDYRIWIQLPGGLFGGPSTIIALPPTGQSNSSLPPYDSSKINYFTKLGQSVTWFANTTAVIDRIAQNVNRLTVQVRINNTTGYVMTQENPFIYWQASIIGGDGFIAAALESRGVLVPPYSIPPGQSSSATINIDIPVSSKLKGAVLVLRGQTQNDGTKWFAFDLSDVQ